MVRKFTTLCSPMVCVEEKGLQLSQKSILCMGKAKYSSQKTLHTLCEDRSCLVGSERERAFASCPSGISLSAAFCIFSVSPKGGYQGAPPPPPPLP